MSSDKQENQDSVINDLNREWRAIVLDQLKGLQKGIKDLEEKISRQSDTFALKTEVATLEVKVLNLFEKLEKMEAFRNKAIGIVVATEAIAGFLIYLYVEGKLPH